MHIANTAGVTTGSVNLGHAMPWARHALRLDTLLSEVSPVQLDDESEEEADNDYCYYIGNVKIRRRLTSEERRRFNIILQMSDLPTDST